MALIKINIPSSGNLDNRVANAFAAQYGYTTNIPDGSGHMIPNPVTKAQFVENVLRDFIKNVLIGHEADEQATIARDQVKQAAATGVIFG